MIQKSRVRLSGSLIAITIAAILGHSAVASAQSQRPHPKQFDISDQLLAKALNEFARQSDQQILFSTEVVNAKYTQGVKGALEPEAALRQLLNGTDLTYRVTVDNAILVEDMRSGRMGDEKYIRLAQADKPSASGGEGQVDVEKAARSQERIELEEILVTGTRIRGKTAAGSRISVVDRRYIEESGYATVPDILRTIPQTYGGGVGEAQSGLTRDQTAGNFARGTALNLRGLGADSTLVLVDGRRQAGSGANGAFFDVSAIPAAAVERVEILSDGASAIYGSDAIGGVVNFVLRRDFAGAESRARFGTYDGDASERQASQLLGASWDTGSALLSYQYSHRDNLSRSRREYTASNDLRRFGGSDYRGLSANPGNIIDPSTGLPAFAVPENQDGTSLTPEMLLPGAINYSDTGKTADLLPEQEMHSAYFNLTQRVGSVVELFADGRFTRRRSDERQGGDFRTLRVPSTNPFFVDPFGGRSSVLVAYNFLDDLGAVRYRADVDAYAADLGANFEASSGWRASVAVSHGGERDHTEASNLTSVSALSAALADPNPSTAFNPFGDGSNTSASTLAAIRKVQLSRYDSDISTLTATADGPLWYSPMGPIRLAIGGDYREESNTGVQFDVPSTTPATSHDLERNVAAVFAEIAVPIVEEVRGVPGVRRLDLSLAGRQERYSDFGDTFNSKIGLAWKPGQAWTVRGAWGTSFKAPRLIELSAIPRVTNFDLITPLQSPLGRVNALLRIGNNPDLQEQTATTWTAGVEYGEDADGPVNAYLTFFDIRYENRIVAGGPPGNPLGTLLAAETWASIIHPNPTQAELDVLCNGAAYVNFGFPCDATQVAAIVDLRLSNLSEVRSRGIDFGIKHTHRTRSGWLYDFRVDGTYTDKFDQAVTPTSPTTSLVDTLGNVPALRLRGGMLWNKGRISAGGFVNFTKGYTDNLSIPHRDIGSWTTLDVSAAYRIPPGAGPIGDVDISASAVNVLNEAPPFADVGSVGGGAFGYDTGNGNLYGRILSISISKRW